MLAELNEAYSTLRDPSTRANYDELRAGKQRREAPPPPRPQRDRQESPFPPAFGGGELTPGQAAFGSLPENVQKRLLERQRNTGEDQLQIKLSSPAWNYLFVVILLFWYLYLFAAADGAKWKGDTLLWYTGITLVISGLIGHNCITIYTYAKAKLKPYFYVTPLYFLKTEFDIVSFRPIWSLKDVSVTHKYVNGSYQNSDIVLVFDGHNESLSISSKEQVESLFNRMQSYNARLRSAFENADYNYFLSNDDFHQVSRSRVPVASLLSRGKRVLIFAATLFVGVAGFIVAIATNEALARERWVRHPTPAMSTPQPTPSRVSAPSYPEQPLPLSGAVRTWTSSERIAPFEIKAAQESNYLLKLVDAYTYNPVMTVFVRGGSTVEVKVPLGTFEVRYASGTKWYGYEYMFGPETAYNKAEETFTFGVIGNQITGYTITLYKVAGGNLRTSTINPTDF